MHLKIENQRLTAPCRAVTFTPDGKHLIEANYLGIISIRSTQTGETLVEKYVQTALLENVKYDLVTNKVYVCGAGFEGGKDFGTIKELEFPSLNYIKFLSGHLDDVTDITFFNSNDQRKIASIGLDGLLLVHDIKTGNIELSFDYGDYLNMVAVNQSNNWIAVAGDGEHSIVYDFENCVLLAKIYTPGDSNGLLWTPDGKYLLVGDDTGLIQYFCVDSDFNLVGRKKVNGAVKRIVTDPKDSSNGLLACYDGKIYNIPLQPSEETSQLEIEINNQNGLWGFSVAATKNHIAVSSFDDRAILIDRTSKAIIGERKKTYGINWFEIDHNSGVIYSTHDDGNIRLWDLATGQLQGSIFGQTNTLFMGCSLHPRLALVATVDFNGNVLMYSTQSFDLVDKFHLPIGPGITISFSACGKFLAVGGYRSDAWVFNIAENGKFDGNPTQLESPNNGVVKNLNFLANGDILIASGDAKIISHQLINNVWKPNKVIETHPSMQLVNAVSYSDITQSMYTASRDQGVRKIKYSDSSVEITRFVHNRSVKTVFVSACGNYVLSGGYDRTIILWDAENLEPILPPLRQANSGISCVRMHDNVIYSSSFDGYLTAWDLNGKILWTNKVNF